jgi:hypothetical protein
LADQKRIQHRPRERLLFYPRCLVALGLRPHYAILSLDV